MYINKFLIFSALLLASCGTNNVIKPVTVATSNPTDIQNGIMSSSSLYGYDEDGQGQYDRKAFGFRWNLGRR